MTLIEGSVSGEGQRFALIVARFNHFVTEPLLKGALAALKEHGVSDEAITVVRVPGTFELPPVASRLARSGRFDALIAIGAVIRGGTPHFEHVAGACSRGLAAVATDTGIPVIFGVLTVDSIEQAIERAGTKAGNKGAEAAAGAIEMISVMRQI